DGRGVGHLLFLTRSGGHRDPGLVGQMFLFSKTWPGKKSSPEPCAKADQHFLIAYMNDELQSRNEPRVGPEFLSNLWDEHMRHEFATHNTEDTLATMVDDAYVNHIPVLTGGVGKDALREFYSKRFIPQMPPDTEVTPVSRTIGADQLVDEMIFKFTHTVRMDWMLPGIPPNGKRVEVPLVAIVRFRGDKLAHEHIYWDQASVLVQLGLLDPNNLPVAGIET